MSKTQIQLVFDPYRLRTAAAGIMVHGPADYVAACAHISQALHQKTSIPLVVQVYDATVGEWLKSWIDPYGHLIQIITYTPYAMLKERWNIDIPALDDSEIIDSGLLNEDIVVSDGQSFENVLLAHFYDTFFTYTSFPERLLSDYLNVAGSIAWEKNANRTIVARVLRDRLTQWENKENSSARRSVISQLTKDWQNLRLSLAKYKLTQGYPAMVGEKTLGDQYRELHRAEIDTQSLSLDDLDLREVVIQIEYYLSEARGKIQNAEDLLGMLEQFSGHLLEEFSFFEGLLLQNSTLVTAELIRRVERRFAPIRPSIASRLARLQRLVAVPFPPAPNNAWSVNEWLNWVVNAYMPYHRWLEAQNSYDETIAEYAFAFSDWYYENYIALKNSSPETFTFSTLYDDRSRFMDDHIALVIVLDNLNYGFFPELRKLFNRNGIMLASERPVLSLIPTATEIGKAAIMAVTGDLTDLLTTEYPSLVSRTWDRLLGPYGKSAKYLARLGDLQNLTNLSDQLLFLNYLPVDEILHGSAQTYGQDHESRIQEALRVLVESIVEFSKRFSLEKRLLIYIVSDHGSTKIAKDTVNVLDKKYFKNISDIQHHRYVAISEKQLSGIPQMVESQCYIVDRKKFKTSENYLVARRYYRFSKTDQDFYVHGGLTPEEVVVPFARFEFMRTSIENPTVRLVKNEFRYAVKSKIEFEIGNPNLFVLENISLKLIGMDTEDVFIESLPSKTDRIVSFLTVFRKQPVTSTTQDITLHIEFESQQQVIKPIDVTFAVNMKTMMETTDDFNF